MFFEVNNLNKFFGTHQVLKSISFKLDHNCHYAIQGASGSGKSTLLHLLGTLDKPSSGSIFIEDKAIHSMNDRQLAQFRNQHIGFIFQFHNLLPEFTALENVCIPSFIKGNGPDQSEARALELLTLLGLKDRADHKPSQLSGGEQQRVAVARALINNPKVIFADEPSGNLDSKNAKELHELFFQLRKDFGQTFVIVTHNDELARMADRMLTMRDGKVEI